MLQAQRADAWTHTPAVAETGNIPPGNAPGETRWQSRTAKPPRPEIRLTGGKGITGVTIEQLIDQVVKDVKVSMRRAGRRSPLSRAAGDAAAAPLAIGRRALRPPGGPPS